MKFCLFPSVCNKNEDHYTPVRRSILLKQTSTLEGHKAEALLLSRRSEHYAEQSWKIRSLSAVLRFTFFHPDLSVSGITVF
jgi:hypothetical protein